MYVILGWCRQREKIDWQEPRKFDCWLVWTIFIFCCPLGWRQDNRNRSNQESKFDFPATRQQLGKMNGGQQVISWFPVLKFFLRLCKEMVDADKSFSVIRTLFTGTVCSLHAFHPRDLPKCALSSRILSHTMAPFLGNNLISSQISGIVCKFVEQPFDTIKVCEIQFFSTTQQGNV